jgi:hypothetical protein
MISPHDIVPAMAKKKNLSKASGTSAFAFMNHGGKRKGAGRKAKRHADGSRVEPSHQRRPRFTKSRPLHVTLEVNEEVPNLRAAHMAPVVSDAATATGMQSRPHVKGRRAASRRSAKNGNNECVLAHAALRAEEARHTNRALGVSAAVRIRSNSSY